MPWHASCINIFPDIRIKSEVPLSGPCEGIMETDYSEIRFGVVAVKKGFVTPDHIVKALSDQVSENLISGAHRAIGTILLDQDLITPLQLEEVLDAINETNSQALKEEAVNI